MMKLALGLDVGNALLKLAGPQRERHTIVPHAIANARGTDNRDPALLPSNADPLEYLHAEVYSQALPDSQEIYVGALAAREYPHLVEEAREGEAKATSDRHLVLALASMGAVLHTANASQSRYHISLAAALPLSEVKDRQARELWASRLRGDHVIQYRSTPGMVGKEITLSIEHVDVVPEGAAAYFALIGRQPALVQDHVLMVDIGARSLDWAAFGPGGRFTLGLSGGTADGGLSVVADRVLASARQLHGPHLARHRQDVLSALEDHARNRRPVRLYGHGRPYDVTQIADAELTRLARDIGRIIGEAVHRMGQIDHLALVGGGGTLLAPYLVNSGLPFQLMDGAPWANADGLYQRAYTQLQQRLNNRVS